MQMTKLLLPGMVEKRKGIVVNVSSLSGDFARNIYSASKVHKWHSNYFVCIIVNNAYNTCLTRHTVTIASNNYQTCHQSGHNWK